MKVYLLVFLFAIVATVAFGEIGYRFKRHPFDGYHGGHRGGFEEREYERSRYGGRGHGGFEERGFERRHHGGGFGGRGGFEEREYERARFGGGHGGRDFDRHHGDRGYGFGGRGGPGGIRGGGLGPRDVGSSTITETRGPLGNTHTSVVTNKVSPPLIGPHFG